MIVWKMDFRGSPMGRMAYWLNVAFILTLAVIFYVLSLVGLGWWYIYPYGSNGLFLPVLMLIAVSICSVYLMALMFNVAVLRLDALGAKRWYVILLALPVVGLLFLLALGLLPTRLKVSR